MFIWTCRRSRNTVVMSPLVRLGIAHIIQSNAGGANVASPQFPGSPRSAHAIRKMGEVYTSRPLVLEVRSDHPGSSQLTELEPHSYKLVGSSRSPCEAVWIHPGVLAKGGHDSPTSRRVPCAFCLLCKCLRNSNGKVVMCLTF